MTKAFMNVRGFSDPAESAGVDTERFRIMQSIGRSLKIDPELLEASELAVQLNIEELVILSQEVAKAMQLFLTNTK